MEDGGYLPWFISCLFLVFCPSCFPAHREILGYSVVKFSIPPYYDGDCRNIICVFSSIFMNLSIMNNKQTEASN